METIGAAVETIKVIVIGKERGGEPRIATINAGDFTPEIYAHIDAPEVADAPKIEEEVAAAAPADEPEAGEAPAEEIPVRKRRVKKQD